MKKYLMLVLIIIFSLAVFAQPQTEERIKALSKDMCDCIRPALDTLHPQLQALMIVSVEQGPDSANKAFEKWLGTASEKEKLIIQQHISMLEQGEVFTVIQDCEMKLLLKYPESAAQLKNNDPVFYKKIGDYLMAMPGCKLLGAIMVEASKRKE